MLSRAPAISVIIPALNEERSIRECLGSLARLQYPGEWDVILADNGSTDRTLEAAGAFADRLNLSVLQQPGVTVSALRNAGARMALGERLVFLDADCVVRPDWLEQSAALSRQTGALLLGAQFRLPDNASWVARVWWNYEQRDPGALSYLSAHNLHIGREDFLRLGGFDESLESNEDYEFSRRVLNSGGRILACPELSVVHLGNAETLRGFFRRERWHGKDVFRVFWTNLRERRNLRAVAFTLYTLLSLADLAAGLASGLAWHTWTWFAIGMGALLAAPLALSVRAAAMVGRWRLVPGLAVLFLIYGIARTVALFDNGRTPQRKVMKVATS